MHRAPPSPDVRTGPGGAPSAEQKIQDWRSPDTTAAAETQEPSSWRSRFHVHPAADVFPMMSDAELGELGEDIRSHGLNTSITLDSDGFLIDGRNRLEAMERAGVELRPWQVHTIGTADPVAFIIGRNVHRRHLTKEAKAELIVAALRASAKNLAKVGEVSPKGGRGKIDGLKAAAVASAAEHGIGRRTVERALAKSAGRKPQRPVRSAQPRRPEPLNSLAWSEATPEQRARFVDAVGFISITDAANFGNRRHGLREAYAAAVARLGVGEIVTELDELKQRVRELKGLAPERGTS